MSNQVKSSLPGLAAVSTCLAVALLGCPAGTYREASSPAHSASQVVPPATADEQQVLDIVDFWLPESGVVGQPVKFGVTAQRQGGCNLVASVSVNVVAVQRVQISAWLPPTRSTQACLAEVVSSPAEFIPTSTGTYWVEAVKPPGATWQVSSRSIVITEATSSPTP